jgi:hypothetical protein
LPNLGCDFDKDLRTASFRETGHSYEWSPAKRDKRRITLTIDGTIVALDEINLARAADRRAYVASARDLNGHAETVERELKTLNVMLSEPDDEPDDEAGKQTTATKLVALAMSNGLNLFHDPNGDAYGSMPVNDHREVWRLREKGFREWLGRLYYDVHKTVPGSQATQDAIGVLEGQARFDGEECPVPSISIWAMRPGGPLK